jgi:hypothetical protein
VASSQKRLKRGVHVNALEWESSHVLDAFAPLVDALRRDAELSGAGVNAADLDAVACARTVAQLVQLQDDLFGRKGNCVCVCAKRETK